MENTKKEYAEKWAKSSKYFYDNKSYSWMASQLSDCDIIVEIGCGTGYSTLSLVENGHTVIAIENNEYCLLKAKELIAEKGYTEKVTFLEGDIINDILKNNLSKNFYFDAVICWNVGTNLNKDTYRTYIEDMKKYGLNESQIFDCPESSYSELVIWNAFKLAHKKNVSIHFIERTHQNIDVKSNNYFESLKNEFGYSEIIYDFIQATSLSTDGVQLLNNNGICKSSKVDITLLSIRFNLI